MITSLKFFAALVTVEGISNIFIAAIGTGLGVRRFLDRLTAAGTEFGVRCEIFVTGRTLIEDKLLMAAMGTEFGVKWYGLTAIRTEYCLPAFLLFGLRQPARKILGKHCRHHKSHTSAHAGTRTALGLRCLFHGHGTFHLHKLVHVIEDTHAASVVNSLLDLGGRCDGVDVEMGQVNTEMAEIFMQTLGQAL